MWSVMEKMASAQRSCSGGALRAGRHQSQQERKGAIRRRRYRKEGLLESLVTGEGIGSHYRTCMRIWYKENKCLKKLQEGRLDWDKQGWMDENDRSKVRKERKATQIEMDGPGTYDEFLLPFQAHAQAWHSYNTTWRSKQQGLVGISLNCDWGEPVDISNHKDIEAAERYLQFCLGWFANPIYAGDYPQVMKDYIGRKSAEQGLEMSRLPVFSLQEKSYIKGTSDFLGLGHFTTRYIMERKNPSRQGPSHQNDRDLIELVDPNWPDVGSKGLYSVPWGFRRLLNFAQTQYGDPPIYVMENGAPQKFHCTQLCDEWRIQYLKGYINEMLKAIKDGANIKGYTSWSLLDKFEWEKGYSDRYGFYYVEFNDRNKPRYPKASVQYYKKIIIANGFPNPREVESWYLKALETCSINNQRLAAEPLLSHMQMVTEIVPMTYTNAIPSSRVGLALGLKDIE
ncbi:hypothetical protein H8959_015674 [Pygathrix nigripes]